MDSNMSNAYTICKIHYIESGKRNGCGKCPIMKECQSSHEWSQSGLLNWQNKCESAAIKVNQL